MLDQYKTKEQLIKELAELRHKFAESERLETKRKRVEEKLRDSEEKYRLMAETSPDAVNTTDLEGRINYASQRTLELHGFKNAEELLGKSAFELIVPEEREKAKSNLKRTMEEGILRNIQYTFLRKDGSRFPAELSSALITDSSGKPISFIAITRDITDRRLAEEKFKESQRMLKASERELRQFSCNILSIREEEKKNLSTILHHEVGSTAVDLNLNWAAIKRAIKNNNMKDALKIYEKSRNTLKKFFSKLKNIALELRPPDLDIIGLPNALKEYFSDIKERTNIKINFHVDMDKERIRNDVAIVLYRIVQEVLNNIIKHADANTVKVTMHSRGNRIKLSVCDNGKGFDIGKTLGGAKRHMGLRAMREMAECLKGRFDIKSEPGKGTEVSINLHAHKEI